MELVEGIGRVEDHGGSLGRARRLFPHAPEPFVDLSTGINPHSYPLFDLPATALTRLPEPGRDRRTERGCGPRLWRAIRRACRSRAGHANSAAARHGAHAARAAKVLGPTYAEHARAAALAGHQVAGGAGFRRTGRRRHCDRRQSEQPGRTHRRARRPAGTGRRDCRAKAACWWSTRLSWMLGPLRRVFRPMSGALGLVVLRSFGKFFGLAGVRLGFMLANQDITARISSELGPWAVSGPALEIGIRALADTGWQQAMRQRLAAETARLDDLLREVACPLPVGRTCTGLSSWQMRADFSIARRGRHAGAQFQLERHRAAHWPAGG